MLGGRLGSDNALEYELFSRREEDLLSRVRRELTRFVMGDVVLRMDERSGRLVERRRVAK